MKTSPHHLLTRDGLTRLKSGHPWIYRTQLTDAYAQPESAGILAVNDEWFFFSPRSEIRLRRLGPFLTPIAAGGPLAFISDAAEFEKRFSESLLEHFTALFKRKRMLVGGELCFRWVFSETDLIPGLVVDVFDRDVVIQIQAAPLELFWGAFRACLETAFERNRGHKPNLIELRNMPVRKKEGLEIVPVTRDAESGAGKWIPWNGFEWWMNPGGPQKTGAYLDQKDNHAAAVHWARALELKEAWDLCCFEGGFGIPLAQAGLKVWAVDQSETALATARKNAERNAIPESSFETQAANIFDVLREKHQQRQRTDLIVLDPPSFVRSRKDVEGAMRGLKELNLRALHCLRPGGLLVTCTCSHHIGPYELNEVLIEAARDSRRRLKILENRGPAPDHAPLEGFPESQYLQARYLEVL